MVKRIVSSKVGWLLSAATILLLFHTLIFFVPLKLWYLELLTHFGEYALWSAVFLLALLLCNFNNFNVSQFVALIVILSLVILFQSSHYIPFFTEGDKSAKFDKEEQNHDSYTVFYANINALAETNNALAKLIKLKSPDILALVEFNSAWQRKLQVLNHYPYKLVRSGIGAYGLALYSKLDFTEVRPKGLGFDIVPTLHVKLKQSQVQLSLLHMMPPINKAAYWHNRAMARRLSTLYKHSDLRSIVLGDFNATPHSLVYGTVSYGAKLKNVFMNRGVPRTWSLNHWYLSLPIDHAFYKGGIVIDEARVLGNFGSDHVPIFFKFSLT